MKPPPPFKKPIQRRTPFFCGPVDEDSVAEDAYSTPALPTPWHEIFDVFSVVNVEPDSQFAVYINGLELLDRNCALLQYDSTIVSPRENARSTHDPQDSSNVTLLICVHGAGQTALSWGLTSKELGDKFITVAFDLRGHGLTRTNRQDDLSIGVLVNDTVSFIAAVREALCLTKKPVLLAGNSLGGSVVTRAAADQKIDELLGIIVIDVVEGTARTAFPQLEHFACQFPKYFNTQSEAIEWALQRGIIQRKEAASISIPSQLLNDTTIQKWIWRVSLRETRKFWPGWFNNLSSAFLSVKVPKVLLLTSYDNLDKELLIAYMQGQFQLQIASNAGHLIMEDQPEEVAASITGLCERTMKVRKLIKKCSHS